jgi:hypothetical protein
MDLYAAKGSVACLERPRRVLGEAAKDTPAA